MTRRDWYEFAGSVLVACAIAGLLWILTGGH
jgi:hypothetical protein